MEPETYQALYQSTLHILVRLGVAALAGLVLGVPVKDRPGGLRTHVLVTLGAALFCITGARYAAETGNDALRVLQGIASGIGFVGAATVLKKGEYIYGVSTAASIWIAASIGSEAGLGNPVLAGILAVPVAFIHGLLRVMEGRGIKHRRTFDGKKTGTEQ